MYLTKTPHPANFAFARSFDPTSGRIFIDGHALELDISSFENGVYRLAVRDKAQWPDPLNLVELVPTCASAQTSRLTVDIDAQISLLGDRGKALLDSLAGCSFGVMDKAWMFVFESPENARYYGMGEKTFETLEVSGKRSKFWNVDAWADHHFAQWKEHSSDPYYLSIPYVIVQRGQEFIGLLIENPCAPFIETGAGTTIPTEYVEPRSLILGAEDGEPILWILYGPTLQELTRKLQKLVGVTPLPPLWALGYHQSRWGYGGHEDLVALDENFKIHDVPCDGLWLDIDYMDGYRVFTYPADRFPKGPKAATEAVKPRRVVAILDPGVKQDPEYSVYRDGVAKGAFCFNPQGLEFVGMVWPGRTVFPDFTLAQVRAWWADYAKDFRGKGFSGAWLDMNDPSTGAVDPHAMLFRRGKHPHLHFHNQYALGMQIATREGFLAAEPQLRPFLLTRSGWIGTSRFSAVWTGDNVSNRFYLRTCIPTTLNLSLSGIPFNGPDVGGFGDDTNEALLVDWVKCCFLFPFMRNHSMFGSRAQEPWAFSPRALHIIRHYIRLRYRLLPYLYNLFMDQEELGDPILRPLLYHYPGQKGLDDQFMIGPDLMHAPFLAETPSRKVHLPGRRPWFELCSGEWIPSGTVEVHRKSMESPLFARDGAIVVASTANRQLPSANLANVEVHVFSQGCPGEVVYRWDDGESFDYMGGKRSSLRIKVKMEAQGPTVDWEILERGFGGLRVQFFFYGRPEKSFIFKGTVLPLEPARRRWTGKELRCSASDSITLCFDSAGEGDASD